MEYRSSSSTQQNHMMTCSYIGSIISSDQNLVMPQGGRARDRKEESPPSLPQSGDQNLVKQLKSECSDHQPAHSMAETLPSKSRSERSHQPALSVAQTSNTPILGCSSHLTHISYSEYRLSISLF
ncbi:hypothetical protein FH972_025360 [Carpinus fangiana]|uniref:Uncharacterized protein n=1 Tax=Carpinus fangiana TaxID=176857 RepID=A0A5N6L1S9_9ROSI|nr:hypothetical protein FH972_025360 [Carpinus fangiana]